MPLFLTPQSRSAHVFSPLKANLDDMVRATEELSEQLAFIVDDSATYGLMTEDTFLENVPQVLKLLDRISALVTNSTRDLTFDDEVFERSDSTVVALSLYSFLSTHRQALSTLAAEQATVKSAGPLFESVARRVEAQRAALQSFHEVLDRVYVDVTERTRENWELFDAVLGDVVGAYPHPSEVVAS